MTETIAADHAEFRLGDGFVKVAIIENKNGPECWIYDLEGSGVEAGRLMYRARKQAWDWGFEEVWANVTNPDLAVALKNHGWTLEQVILKGKTDGN